MMSAAERDVLRQLEDQPGDATPALAWLAAQKLDLSGGELSAARRRALLLLASGGDPRRELDPDNRAVASLAGDLHSAERLSALHDVLRELRAHADGFGGVAAALDGLLADPDLAWRWVAYGLLAEELTK
jgi:hypothetical protein